MPGRCFTGWADWRGASGEERQVGVRHWEKTHGAREERREKQERQAGSNLGVSVPSENELITWQSDAS